MTLSTPQAETDSEERKGSLSLFPHGADFPYKGQMVRPEPSTWAGARVGEESVLGPSRNSHTGALQK